MFDRMQWAYDNMECDYYHEEPDILNTSDLIEVRSRFQEAVEILCNHGELDIEYLDDCLGQISKILGVNYSPNSPKIERIDIRNH